MTGPSLSLLCGTALAWGLAGGFSHCIGMCGVFVVSYAGVPDAGLVGARRFVRPERHALFHGGRLASLGLLGLGGGAIGALGHRYAALDGAVSLAVGLLMLGLALGMAGIVPRFRLPEPDVLGAGGGRGRRLFGRALRSRSALKPLLVGVFVGLLPCGLTYNALIPTFDLHSPLHGALLMLCFGLGTVPGLLALGVFGSVGGGLLTSLKFRAAMTRVAALLMAVLGAAFLWRGASGF